MSRAARLGAAGLGLGCVSAVLAAAGPYGLMPFADLARAAAADSTVAVAFVVDFAGGAAPVVGCIKVPSGTNGYQALAAFTAQEQEQAPTYNASQLLCSINGIPGSGCGQAVPGGYVYWSYWRGATGAWQYAQSGAFAAVQPGDVEGWRFENPGKANPSDSPPGASPDYGAICGAALSTPPATAASGSTGQSNPVGPAGAPAQPPTSSSTIGASTDNPAGGRGPSPSGVPPSTVPGAPVASALTTRPTPVGHPQPLRAAEARSARPPSGDGALPAAIGGGLVMVLAGLAYWRWRQRRVP